MLLASRMRHAMQARLSFVSPTFPSNNAVLLLPFGSVSPRFTAVRIGLGGAQGVGTGPYDTGGGFVEEYLLEDFELSPADLGE